MDAATTRSDLRLWQHAAIAVLFALFCLAVGWISGAAADRDTLWYWDLEKPFFYPPEELFAPVWTVLYILMGLAAYLVWRAGLRQGEVQWALILFAAQLAFNAAWTPVFFGAQAIGGALLVMLGLIVLLALTIRQFFRVNRLAGYLLLPYGLWVLYAAALNAALWVMN